MFSPLTTLIALLLMSLAAALIAMHRRAWYAVRDGDAEDRETHFAARQFRRRVQASGMLGMAGLVMLLGQFVSDPLIVVWIWAGVMILLAWVMLLACGDVIASQRHFSHLRRETLDQHARLQADLYRRRERNSDGHSGETSEGT